eukprot:TRINITY_DN7049_c0_g1_i1.p3 TRINITY_DN7049_c0_g1~~TRINITY_DN7049_c0_g1_i1.p3  ORF type:complete len:104 (-),score=20.35 TRINITY_DN7049_c0_g1_i1:336-647(-)
MCIRDSLNTVSNKSPQLLMREIFQAVETQNIQYKALSRYSLKCEAEAVDFEVELNAIKNAENLFVVRMTRLTGDLLKYNEICRTFFRLVHLQEEAGKNEKTVS